MDPGQDLLLAALSESGICPNDLFDIDPQDAQPSSTQQVVISVVSCNVLNIITSQFSHDQGEGDVERSASFQAVPPQLRTFTLFFFKLVCSALHTFVRGVFWI